MIVMLVIVRYGNLTPVTFSAPFVETTSVSNDVDSDSFSVMEPILMLDNAMLDSHLNWNNL